MLPVTENNSKQLAKPVPGLEEGKDTKAFEVNGRTVAIHTATDVVITISDFTPLNNGMHEFGSNVWYNGEPIFPLLLRMEAADQPSKKPFFFETQYGGHTLISAVGLAEMPRMETLPGLDVEEITETSRESGFEDSDLDEDEDSVFAQEGDLKAQMAGQFKKMGILAEKVGPVSISTSAAPDKGLTIFPKGGKKQ